MLYVNNRDYPFKISTSEVNKTDSQFKSKHVAMNYRFKVLLKYMNKGTQNVVTIYKQCKVYKVYTREFLTMSYKKRLELYPEIYI